jgi:two-component system, OmpR family, copper resistance phosphate regulon response regulator CusR
VFGGLRSGRRGPGAVGLAPRVAVDAVSGARVRNSRKPGNVSCHAARLISGWRGESAARPPLQKSQESVDARPVTFRLVRVLVVEDERKLAQILASALQAEHYDVVVAATGEDGFFRANAEVFDLVVLDLMLPGRSGLEILQALRQRRIETPVLILTARDDVGDRVLGLDLGADDYLVKPFALPELLARIRALLRRGRPSDVLRLKAADLELDLVTRRATRGDSALDLTAREFELLEYLLRHQGRLVSREMLAREVWREPRRATPLDNVIDVQMTRLRRKVDTEGGPRLIHTVRGVGFVLREGEP